ncbi:MAG: 16S rRNA pseudouridine(516) synthase, partial [Dysosmobacter sp.]|nr:16S rRNA pseudouridine(516) synthase [Dysosmobacter sp.]
MAKERLDKIVASTGKWSRREAKELARRGLVMVDGAAVRSVEEKFDPEEAEILVNGEALSYRRYTWIMLNKPAGYLSASSDSRGKTVLDLLPRELRRQELFPVGRLDKDTEGLLL